MPEKCGGEMEVKNAESAVLPCAVSWTGVGEKFSKSKNQKKKEKFFFKCKIKLPAPTEQNFFSDVEKFSKSPLLENCSKSPLFGGH
jgi:hypothetical protein